MILLTGLPEEKMIFYDLEQKKRIDCDNDIIINEDFQNILIDPINENTFLIINTNCIEKIYLKRSHFTFASKDNNLKEFFKVEKSVLFSFTNEIINSVVFSKNESVWVSTNDQRILEININSKEIIYQTNTEMINDCLIVTKKYLISAQRYIQL